MPIWIRINSSWLQCKCFVVGTEPAVLTRRLSNDEMANNANSKERRFIDIYPTLVKDFQRKIIDYIKLLQRPQGGTGLRPSRAARALRPSTAADPDFDFVDGLDNTFNGEKTANDQLVRLVQWYLTKEYSK